MSTKAVLTCLGGVTVNKIIIDYLYYFGELGVNCFILISGYFLPQMNFRWSKVALLAAQSVFYVVLSRGVLVWSGLAEWSQWRIRDYFFPILIPQYWFVTAYALIYIFSPYLKQLVEAVDKRDFQKLLVLWFLIWSFFPTVVLGYVYGGTDVEATQNYNRFIWLLGMYLAGCYIRMYGVPPVLESRKNRAYVLAGAALCLLGHIILAESGLAIGGKSAVYFWPPNSVAEVVCSLALFLYFEKINLKYSLIINTMASCTLGIYMLHDGALAYFWWTNVFANATHQHSRFFFLHIVFAVLVIMGLGLVCDLVRQGVEERVVVPIMDRNNKFVIDKR